MKRLLILLAGMLPMAASAASFDCGKARAIIEILICADDGLSELDRQVGEAHFLTLNAASGGMREALLADQRDFLSSRLQRCPVPMIEELTESHTAPIIGCLKEVYRNRLAQLQSKRPAAADAPVENGDDDATPTHGNRDPLCEPAAARAYYEQVCVAEGLHIAGESGAETFEVKAETLRAKLGCNTDAQDSLRIRASNAARGLLDSDAISTLMDVQDAFIQECRRSAKAL